MEMQRSSPGEMTNGGGTASTLSKGLGWFSIGLGLAEVVAPGALARFIGIDDDRRSKGTLRAMGARELASGLAILREPTRPAAVWSRVAGDAMDLALLGLAFGTKREEPRRLIGAIGAVLGVAALDVVAGVMTSKQKPVALEPIHKTITVNASPSECYAAWREFSQLPRFMSYLERVDVLDERRSHWVASAAGVTLEWDAEITDDRPGQRIAWQSIEGSEVDVKGSVTFVSAPGDRGTEIHVLMSYRVPGGKAAAALAKLIGREPGQLVQGDLRRFKAMLEAGDVPRSDASIHTSMHPARPSAEKEITR